MKTSEIPCSPSSGLISIRLTSQRQSKLKCWSWGIRITRTLCLATNACHHVTYWFACGYGIFSKIYTSKHWKTDQLCPTLHLCSRSHTDTVSDHGLWSQKARWRSLEMKNTQQHYSLTQPSVILHLGYSEALRMHAAKNLWTCQCIQCIGNAKCKIFSAFRKQCLLSHPFSCQANAVMRFCSKVHFYPILKDSKQWASEKLWIYRPQFGFGSSHCRWPHAPRLVAA